MSNLRISETLSLPLDITGKKIAFLGTTGSGKSYAGMKLAEELFASGAQFVVLDVVGIWYGLRIHRDGKRPGLQIPVFGGLHGDIPLDPGSGALVADLIVDRNLTAILDISQMDSDAEAGRFAAAFASRLFHRRKAKPAATMVFLEECQEFIPENPGKDETQKLHAFTRLAKIGRNFGIGVALISQRPQEISKKVLNLSECVFAFQMNGKHERRAIADWLSNVGADSVDVDALPNLEVGTAHVWSPRWLKISKEVKISARSTFDASSTPDFEEASAIHTKPLLPADMEAISRTMAETIEKAKADDPRELRKKIAALEKQLAAKPAAPAPVVPLPPKVVEVPILKDLQIDRLNKAVEGIVSAIRQATTCENFLKSEVAAATAKATRALPVGPTVHVKLPMRPPVTQVDGSLSGPEQRILNAISWLEDIGILSPEQTAVAFMAGYTIGGGGFNNPKGSLRSKGLLEYRPGDKVRLTEQGRIRAEHAEIPVTAEDLQACVLARLPGPEQKILRVLLAEYPNDVSNEDLAARSGYTNGGGGFNNPRGRLRTLGLIEYNSGRVRARNILFLQ